MKAETDIILPNYNSQKFIDQTIRSVLSQTYKKWRLLIVDDASNKETRSKINRYKKNKKIKIIQLQKNKGAAYCRNLAIKKSKSKYLAFLDSDDIWKKNKLEVQMNFMKKNKYDFTYTFYETIGKKQKKITTPLKFNLQSFLKNTSIATSSMIVTKKILKNIKFTDTPICEDYFFKCSILKKISYAYGMNNYLMKYRISDTSMQSQKLRNIYWIWKINKKFNKLNIINNFISVISISLNSLRKYGLK